MTSDSKWVVFPDGVRVAKLEWVGGTTTDVQLHTKSARCPKRRVHTNWRRHPYKGIPKGAIILPGIGWAAPASEINASQ